MTEKLLLIANPCSGTGKIKTALFGIVKTLSDSGFTVTVYMTTGKADATRKVTESGKDYDMIICCGGDGTLNEVITGLLDNGINIPIGYIPLGTLNEWSSGLHISRNVLTAAQDISKLNLMPLDIGKFADSYFCYTASFGAFTEASYSTPQNFKNVFGQAAYILNGIKYVKDIKAIPLSFMIDGKEISGKYLFGAITNSMSVGGIVHFTESVVKLNDGLFEIMLIKAPKNVKEFNSIVDGILKKDMSKEEIEFYHAKEITVKGGENLSWTLDGEFKKGLDEVKITNLHGAVNFAVPEKKQKEKK